MELPKLEPGQSWTERVAQELRLDEPPPKTTMTAIRLPDDLRARIEATASAKGMTRSEFMRQALADAVTTTDDPAQHRKVTLSTIDGGRTWKLDCE
jgi:predicted transcriptional regulator